MTMDRNIFFLLTGISVLARTLVIFLSAFAIMLAARAEFTGYLGAQYFAFVQNLMMSVLFIHMLKKELPCKASPWQSHWPK